MKTISDLCDVLSEGFGLRRSAVEWLAEEFQRRGFTGPLDGPVNIDTVVLFLLACTSEQPLHPAVVVERFNAMELSYIFADYGNGEAERLEAGYPLFDTLSEGADTFAEGVAITIQAATQRHDPLLWPGAIAITSTARHHAGIVSIGDYDLHYFSPGSEEIGPPIPGRSTTIPASFIERLADLVAPSGPGPGESKPWPEAGDPGDVGEPIDVAA